MAYTIQDVGQGYPKIGSIVSDSDAYVPQPALGTIVRAVDPTYGVGEFIWLDGVASTVVGSWVVYDADEFSTALITPNAKGPVAVAMGASVADYQGWYQIQGKAFGKAADVSDSGDVYIDTAPGVCDDALVVGDRVQRAKWASADDTATTLAEASIARPFVDDGAGGGST